MKEKILKEIAIMVFIDCANMHRNYPNAKHTFTDYWDLASEKIIKTSKELELKQS
jgi:hypothetical protein